MKLLYVNGYLVDLYKQGTIATSYQVSKIAEIRDAQAFFSNRFSVPPTNNNNRIFGFVNDIGSTSLKPYRILPCRYIQNGMDLLEDGAALIYSSKGNYEIEVYSGLYDVFSQIGDKTLAELDFSELDFNFTVANVVGANNGNGPVKYPLIDFGALGTMPVTTLDIRYQEPAIQALYILNKIFSGTNWSKSGDIFTDPKFTDLYLCLTGDPIIDNEEVNKSRSFRVGTQGYSRVGQNARYSVLASGRYDDFSGPDNFDSTAGWLDKSNPNAWKYTARVECLIQVTFNVFAAPNSMGPMYISKGSIPPFFGSFTPVWSSTGIPNSPLLSATTPQIKLLPGESLYIHTSTSAGLFTTNYYPDGNIISNPESKSFIEFKVINSAVVDSPISFTGKLPDMKQIDFIRNMCNIFGMIMQPNNDKREILFKQFKRIRTDGKIKDWSKKIDVSEEPELSFHPEGYYQNNFMRWIQADPSGKIGDASFPINDTTLKRNGDLFVLDFASSLQVVPIIDNNIGIKIPRYVQTEAQAYANNKEYAKNDLVKYAGIVWIMVSNTPQTNVTPGTNSSVWSVYFAQYEFSDSTDPHLVYVRRVSLANSITLTDGNNSPIVVSHMPVAWFSDSSQEYSLDFNFLIDKEYKPLVEMMQLFKQVVANILLNELDIMTLDFFSLVYIEYFGEKFYLNSVEEFVDSSQPTQCTLIRV